MIELRVRCPVESCRALLRTPLDSAGTRCLSCACGRSVSLSVDAALAAEGRVLACPACDGREFFTRKDFPQRLGLAIVSSAGLASCVLLARQQLLWAWGVLAGAAALDAALYFATGRVTVCYRCRAELRGAAYNPAYAGFDLATAEKYPRMP